jgi:pilus assembly protein Flp/PilA
LWTSPEWRPTLALQILIATIYFHISKYWKTDGNATPPRGRGEHPETRLSRKVCFQSTTQPQQPAVCQTARIRLDGAKHFDKAQNLTYAFSVPGSRTMEVLFLTLTVEEWRMVWLMQRVTASAVTFLKGEDGPTAVEYAVMLALIIVVCVTSIAILGTNANNTFSYVGKRVGTTGS